MWSRWRWRGRWKYRWIRIDRRSCQRWCGWHQWRIFFIFDSSSQKAATIVDSFYNSTFPFRIRSSQSIDAFRGRYGASLRVPWMLTDFCWRFLPATSQTLGSRGYAAFFFFLFCSSKPQILIRISPRTHRPSPAHHVISEDDCAGARQNTQCMCG